MCVLGKENYWIKNPQNLTYVENCHDEKLKQKIIVQFVFLTQNLLNPPSISSPGHLEAYFGWAPDICT